MIDLAVELFVTHSALCSIRIQNKDEREYYRHKKITCGFASGDFIVGAASCGKWYDKERPYAYGEIGCRYPPEFFLGGYGN